MITLLLTATLYFQPIIAEPIIKPVMAKRKRSKGNKGRRKGGNGLR